MLDGIVRIMTNSNSKRRDYFLPASILIAAVLVSGAVIYNAGKGTGEPEKAAVPVNTNNPAANVAAVTADDHISGSLGAQITIVEFSDLECPFCKGFHETMQRIVDDYDGQVAWVYRHFPLDNLHSKARKEAEATECAGELGGNEGFWRYIDRLFEITPSNDGLDLSLLPQIAEDVGLNRADFELCLESGKYANHIEADYQDAVQSGGQGTPYSVVITNDGEYQTIPGALPYERIKLYIDEVLASQ